MEPFDPACRWLDQPHAASACYMQCTGWTQYCMQHRGSVLGTTCSPHPRPHSVCSTRCSPHTTSTVCPMPAPGGYIHSKPWGWHMLPSVQGWASCMSSTWYRAPAWDTLYMQCAAQPTAHWLASRVVHGVRTPTSPLCHMLDQWVPGLAVDIALWGQSRDRGYSTGGQAWFAQ